MSIRFGSLSSNGSSEGGLVITFAIIVILVVSRIFRTVRGVRVSGARTIGYMIFYLFFGLFFVVPSFIVGVPVYYAALDVLGAIIAAFISHHLADRRITFWRATDGSIWYKGGIIIYLIYVAGLVARLSIDLIVLGPSAFTFNTHSLSSSALLWTIVTDLLLMFGVGLLIGRNIRVYERYKKILANQESLPAMP